MLNFQKSYSMFSKGAIYVFLQRQNEKNMENDISEKKTEKSISSQFSDSMLS